MSELRVLIRTDASSARGLGHLQRCLSLATALDGQGVRSSFLVAGDDGLARRQEHESTTLAAAPGSDADADETLEAARQHGCAVVVVDSYDADASYLERLGAGSIQIAAIDDRAAFALPARLVINPGIHAERLGYSATSAGTVFLLGPRYALLRQSFENLPPRNSPARGTRVLVAMGGSDPDGLTLPLLRRLAKTGEERHVAAIIGPLAPHPAEIVAAAREIGPRVSLHVDPDDMAELMTAADLAVTAGGQTLYELAAAGTPAVAVIAAQNQVPQCERFAELGFLWIAGRSSDSDITSKVDAVVARVAADQEARSASARIGRQLVDGRGAARVAREIRALVAGS